MVSLLGRFTDLEAGEVDSEAAELLEELKHDKLPTKLDEECLHQFTVPWQTGGTYVLQSEARIHEIFL